MVKRKLNRHGFTLVELIVAMVLIGLVSLIGTSVTMMVSRSQKNFRLDAKSEADMVALSSMVKDWLMQFDVNGYTINVGEEIVTFSHEDNSGALSQGGEASEEEALKMYFNGDDGKFYCGEVSDELDSIKSVSFACSDKLICFNVEFKETSYVHKILYNMRVAEVKEYST